MSAVQGGLAVNGTLLIVGAAASMQVSPLLPLGGRRSIKGWYFGTSIVALTEILPDLIS